MDKAGHYLLASRNEYIAFFRGADSRLHSAESDDDWWTYDKVPEHSSGL